MAITTTWSKPLKAGSVHAPSQFILWAAVFLMEMDYLIPWVNKHPHSREAWHYPNRWCNWFVPHGLWMLMGTLLLVSLSFWIWWDWPPTMSLCLSCALSLDPHTFSLIPPCRFLDSPCTISGAAPCRVSHFMLVLRVYQHPFSDSAGASW